MLQETSEKHSFTRYLSHDFKIFQGTKLVVYQILSVDWFIKVHLISWGEGQGHIAGWWFGTWILFSIYWECHHPNWLSYSSEGRYTTNHPGSEASHFVYVSKGLKPPTSIGIIPYQRPGAVRRHWAYASARPGGVRLQVGIPSAQGSRAVQGHYQGAVPALRSSFFFLI